MNASTKFKPGDLVLIVSTPISTRLDEPYIGAVGTVLAVEFFDIFFKELRYLLDIPCNYGLVMPIESALRLIKAGDLKLTDVPETLTKAPA